MKLLFANWHLKFCILAISLVLFNGCVSNSHKNSQPKERTFSTLVEDEKIESEGRALIRSHKNLAAQSDIEIVSFNYIVLLIGQTPTKSLKQDAQKLIEKIPGIKKIYNEIRVAAPTGSIAYVSDVSITTRVKSALALDTNFDSSRIKVITEDGEVFLLGVLEKDSQLKAINIARNVSGVKRVIEAFELPL